MFSRCLNNICTMLCPTVRSVNVANVSTGTSTASEDLFQTFFNPFQIRDKDP